MSASAGRVLIIPKGIYNAETTYQMLDLVRFGKGTFICKKTSLGNEPSFEADTEYWQLIASSGDVSGVKGNAETEYRDGNVNITYDNLGGVDANLSSLSSLPIQNKAVKAALDEKMDDMDFDNAPTLNSGNLLTSGTVKTALDGKLGTSGNGKDVTVAFTTKDAVATTTEQTNHSTDIPSTIVKLGSGETLASMFSKISAMFKNVRRLWNTVGSTALDTAYGATLTAQVKNLTADRKCLTYEKTWSSTEPSLGTWPNRIYATKKANLVQLVVDISNPSGNNATKVFTLPSELRPLRPTELYVMHDANEGGSEMEISSDGDIYVRRSKGTYWIAQGTILYYASDILTSNVVETIPS